MIDEGHTLRIVHALPGRLRFRGSARAGSEELAEAIRGLPGVQSCTWSPRTRSLLVLFQPEAITPDAITREVARQCEVAESGVVDMSPPTRAGVRDGRGPFAAGVAETFGEIDRRVHRASRGLLGFRGLLPLVLMLWAAREIALGRAAPLAWSTALWYAHGLFRDYNPPAH